MTRRSVLLSAAVALPAQSKKLEVGMHQATVWKCDSDLKQDYEAIAKHGFRQVEVLLRKVDAQKKYSMADVKTMLDDNGLKPLGSQLAPSLGFPDDKLAGRFEAFKRNLDRTAVLGIELTNCACIIRQSGVTIDHFKQAVDNYRKAAELAAEYNVVVVIEFLKFSTFLSTLPSSLWMMRQVNHPNLKVCADAFHIWAGRGKLQDIDDIRSGEVHNFHINDVGAEKPRELLGDADRDMPGTGEIPLVEMVKKLESRGYSRTVMVELFSPKWWARPVDEVCRESRLAADRVMSKI